MVETLSAGLADRQADQADRHRRVDRADDGRRPGREPVGPSSLGGSDANEALHRVRPAHTLEPLPHLQQRTSPYQPANWRRVARAVTAAAGQCEQCGSTNRLTATTGNQGPKAGSMRRGTWRRCASPATTVWKPDDDAPSAVRQRGETPAVPPRGAKPSRRFGQRALAGVNRVRVSPRG